MTDAERRQFGRRFAELRAQGVTNEDIARRFHMARKTVARCLLAVEMGEAREVLACHEPSLLDPATIRMLHVFRDEIRAADARALSVEAEQGNGHAMRADRRRIRSSANFARC